MGCKKKNHLPFIYSCTCVFQRDAASRGQCSSWRILTTLNPPRLFHPSITSLPLCSCSLPALSPFSTSYSSNPSNPPHSFVRLRAPVSGCACVRAYQADVVVQQRQGEEIFQSELVEAGIRQTCQTHTNTQSSGSKSFNPLQLTRSASAGRGEAS